MPIGCFFPAKGCCDGDGCAKDLFEIARRQGAKAWELRAATSLAFLLRESGCLSQARDTLQSVLSHFTQGWGTKDVQAATNLLSELQA